MKHRDDSTTWPTAGEGDRVAKQVPPTSAEEVWGIGRATQELLRLFATKESRKDYLDAVAGLIRSWSGCDSVGVRVLDREGGIPYESTLGFSAVFCASESLLNVHTDRCACTRVISGRPISSDLPYVTPGGSFHCDDARRFLDSLNSEERTNYRGVCISQGFASVTVVPIRYRDRVIGAIHAADGRKACTPPEVVEFLEATGAVVGEAIHRFNLEEDLRRSEEKYRGIFDNAVVGIYQASPDGRLVESNSALARMLGYPDRETFLANGSGLAFVGATREQELYLRLAADGAVEGFEAQLALASGGRAWVAISARVVPEGGGLSSRIEGIVQDITGRKKTEAELRQSQKMEAVGTLAGGIAHDFSNILGVMLGFTEMALDQLEQGSLPRKRLDKALKAGIRGRELVRRILAFSRPSEQDMKPTDVKSVVDDVLALLRPTLPDNITARFRGTANGWLVLADHMQLQQMLMNLITNAVHAMRDEGGLLTIEVGTVSVDETSVAPEIREGDYVELSVRDMGVGIDPSVLDRIFDPFFTTKDRTEGTGLGLSVVHGIVRGHGGAVTVESTPGKGSLFRVYLPRAT